MKTFRNLTSNLIEGVFLYVAHIKALRYRGYFMYESYRVDENFVCSDHLLKMQLLVFPLSISDKRGYR
jgi:hypothetical protein